MKASPTGGGDNAKAKKKPPLLQKARLRSRPIPAAPRARHRAVVGRPSPLSAGLAEHRTRRHHVGNPGTTSLVEFVTRGALVSGFLFLIFALYELRPPQKWWKSLVVIVVWFAVVAAALTIAPGELRLLVWWGAIVLGLLAVALVIRAILRRRIWILWYALLLAGTAIWINVTWTLPATLSATRTFPSSSSPESWPRWCCSSSSSCWGGERTPAPSH